MKREAAKNAKKEYVEKEPFETLTKANRSALIDEAERLVRFTEPGAKSYEVRFEEV